MNLVVTQTFQITINEFSPLQTEIYYLKKSEENINKILTSGVSTKKLEASNFTSLTFCK